MVANFLVSFFLASLNLFLNPVIFKINNSKITNQLILLAFYPVLPILVIILENKTLLELSFCFEEKTAATIKRYQLIKLQTAQFIRTELCIERTLQITFSILLLAFSKSDTRITQGLEAIFDQTGDSNESTLGLLLRHSTRVIADSQQCLGTVFSLERICTRYVIDKKSFSYQCQSSPGPFCGFVCGTPMFHYDHFLDPHPWPTECLEVSIKTFFIFSFAETIFEFQPDINPYLGEFYSF